MDHWQWVLLGLVLIGAWSGSIEAVVVNAAFLAFTFIWDWCERDG